MSQILIAASTESILHAGPHAWKCPKVNDATLTRRRQQDHKADAWSEQRRWPYGPERTIAWQSAWFEFCNFNDWMSSSLLLRMIWEKRHKMCCNSNVKNRWQLNRCVSDSKWCEDKKAKATIDRLLGCPSLQNEKSMSSSAVGRSMGSRGRKARNQWLPGSRDIWN